MTDRHSGVTTDRHASLARPPPPPPGEDILQVDFRLTVFAISDVNTRDLTACVRFGIVLYWTDPRLVGFDEPLLPGDLWGPDVYLRNARGGVRKDCEQFAIVDTEEGRLKRILNFESTIMMPMDLSAFPYDLQVIRPELVCISHWSCAAANGSGKRHGSSPAGQVYALRPVSRPREGKLMWLMNIGGEHGRNTHIAEWILNSYSVKLRTTAHSAGFVMTLLCLELHVSRKYTFYHEKIIAPLLFLTLGAFFLQLVPPEELEDRMNATFTLFVAAMALINVIADTLPKIDYLTVVDKAIYMTLGTLLWLGLESWICYTISWSRGGVLARQVDAFFGVVVPLVYLLTLLCLFWPKNASRARKLRKLLEKHRNQYIESTPVEGLSGNIDIDAGGLAHTDGTVSRTGELATSKQKVAPVQVEGALSWVHP